MAETTDVLIVGGGPAGTRAAETIRRRAPDLRVVVLTDEPRPFTNRILLSKEFLTDDSVPPDAAVLKPAAEFAAQGIELRAGVRTLRLDPGTRRVTLEGGGELRYDRCLIATGAAPLRLPVPGADRPGVHVLRTQEDAVALREAAGAADRAVVVGGGLIGLEVVAALTRRGLACTLVARETWLLGHLAPEPVGRALARTLEAAGVRLALESVVEASQPAGEELAVITSDGRRFVAPLVPTGAGVRCRVELLAGTGLVAGGAVEVDATLRTAAPGLWAAGDVAAWEDPLLRGVRHRVEHWLHAQQQGRTAAANMLGGSEPFARVTAYDTSILGLELAAVGAAGAATSWVMRGPVEDGDGVALGLRDGRVVAAYRLGAAEPVASLTRLIESGGRPA